MSIIPSSGKNWSAEVSRLRQAGYAMPNNPALARMEARRVADTVSSGSLTDLANRHATAEVTRRRLSATRGAHTGMIRTGSDLQMALPKIRQPLSSLMDKGIPFNVNDPKELIELRRWARLFYSTHDLVPLLIDIYAKFPVVGLEFQCKDPLIEKFYSEMFLNELNYEEFLPDAVGREYFVAGEVTTLAHFNEQLGIWSSEEVLNPDMLAVTRSMLVQQERVQLLVKGMVEDLRNGPGGMPNSEERASERMHRQYEYQMLVEQYPEIMQAAARDDGLDMSDALISRIVNRANPWDVRGTPFLLRSFRTLLMEESLNAAQDAVADRLYSPMVLATMGIENTGDGEPWIPSQAELEDLRNDMQSALAADFKLMVHNFGVQVQSVFGRESVPNFSQDYDRIDAKLMQAWGIGQALIMGGTGAGGTYASSALNREVCEQLMLGFQKKVVRHIRKRMEVIAEAQEHYDYELKGGRRVPIYREIVEEDPETGEERIVRVPKLLIPEVHFASLNLRDEATERQFIMQLKEMGVPVSDKMLAVNISVDFEQELEREAQETVDKGMAKAQAFKKLQDLCDEQSLPYPPELAAHLESTLQLRQMLSQTKMSEDQAKMLDMQLAQSSPAGQMGVMPGAPPPGDPSQQGAMMDPSMMGMAADAQGSPDPSGPMMGGPGGPPQEDPTMADAGGAAMAPEPPRNFSRPAESDEQRGGAPRAASARYAKRLHGTRLERFTTGPSSLGTHLRASEERVSTAITRRELLARHSTTPKLSALVRDPDFYAMTNMGSHHNQIESDWPEIREGRALESSALLHEMVEHYEDITGVSPVWD